jgi:hypothetical protein
MAIAEGYAVFALEATTDEVTDAQGRPCGKRFDFSELDRPNIDLPFIEEVITRIIPERRPPGSSRALFMVGHSTGGYMTIKAAAHFDEMITAFAPISAGDPFATMQNCDASLSPRKSAKGILYHVSTGREITEPGACAGQNTETAIRRKETRSPVFRQFHHEADGIVDYSCMQSAAVTLERMGFENAGAYVIEGNKRRGALKHFWLQRYNRPILEFFDAETAGASRP